MEQDEEEICDGVIYADHGRRSRLSIQGGYLRGMHINWGFLSVGLQFGGVISGVISDIPHMGQKCVP